MGMIDNARAYLGRTWIGTNSSDNGECVGLFNKVVQEVTGVLYPIKGASNAISILTANNTRPDICQQVKNIPNNPNQLPSVGDWVIWNGTYGNGQGHIACVESVSSVAMTTIDQNWVRATVTRQQHSWNGIAGWIHFNVNDAPAPTPPPVVDQNPAIIAGLQAENKALKGQLGTANIQLESQQVQISTLTSELTKRDATIDTLNQELAKTKDENEKLIIANQNLSNQVVELQKKLSETSDDTVNLDKLSVLLNWIKERLRLNK